MRPRGACLALALLLAAAAAHPAAPAAPPPPRKKPLMVFSINPGRAGSFFLANVLNTSTEIVAQHEQQPTMSGWAQRQATLLGMDGSYNWRCVYPGHLREYLATLPPGSGYADSTSMFVQTMCDCVMDAFADEYDIRVVWQRRYLPAVLASYRRHRIFDLPNALSLLWSYTPHSPAASFSLTEPLCEWEDCSADEFAVQFLIEHEARGRWFRERYPHVPVYEVRLEELASEAGARGLMQWLGTDFDDAALRGVVARNLDILPKVPDARPRCDSLRYARDLVLAYQRRAERRGVALPPLPGMTPVNDAECGAALAVPPTAAELDHVDAHWPNTSGVPLEIVSPLHGAVLALPDNASLPIYIGVHTPFAGVRRPPLSVERHWLLCSEVRRDGVPPVRKFLDDASLLREVAIEWARGEPRAIRLDGVGPGRNTIAIGVCYYDVEDLLFVGEQQAGSIDPAQMRLLYSTGVEVSLV